MRGYGFSVRHPKEIDLERIVLENPDAVCIIIASGEPPQTAKEGEPTRACLVMLHGGFLERFRQDDSNLVCADRLGPRWGFPQVESDWYVDVFQWVPRRTSDMCCYVPLPGGWRGIVTIFQPDEVMADIQAAIASQLHPVWVSVMTEGDA